MGIMMRKVLGFIGAPDAATRQGVCDPYPPRRGLAPRVRSQTCVPWAKGLHGLPFGVSRCVLFGTGSDRFDRRMPTPQLCTLLTLVRSAERCGINPLAYLTDVLVRVQTHPASDRNALLPDRWRPRAPP